MKTITFYSYKGGVGRTLALINIANRLAEFGKKVCLIDFDLEAPGLVHKYNRYITEPIGKGIVDYVYDFAIDNVVNESILDFSTTISLPNSDTSITLIPAGNSDNQEYWKKLSRINWWDLFYQESSEGIAFFLDLKEKIEKEIQPDYLLIDTRTGVSEIAGVTMNILADSIVLLAVHNEENLCGSKYTIDAILDDNNNILDNNRDIHFVLSRIPLGDSPEKRMQEKEIIKAVKKRIDYTDDAECKISSFNVIHSNRELELNEMNSSGGLGSSFCLNEKENDKNIKLDSISNEYLTLFNSLVKDGLSREEKIKLDDIEEVNNLLIRAHEYFNDPDSSKFISIIKQIREIEPNNINAYVLDGCHLYDRGMVDKAIEQFKKGMSSGDYLGYCLYSLSNTYYDIGDYKKALDGFQDYINKGHRDFEQSVLSTKLSCMVQLCTDFELLLSDLNEALEKYPTLTNVLNLRSNTYNILGQHEKALTDIYKAIDLEPEKAVYYATLAEIKFNTGDVAEFYRNFKIALSKNHDTINIFKDTEFVRNIYKRAAKEPAFIEILEIYEQFDTIAKMKEEGWI